MKNEIKEWFEANFLDGDQVQGGQMLSSQDCLEALSHAYNEGKRAGLKEVLSKYKEIFEKECWETDFNN